ncbi:hypothetical protein HJC10_13800 [Corallococcus exiguus]|uniref:immunity protein TriTu family protein n=1 Tax=Corallococcus exiguus TaxID=83462 RepID=UPI001471E988|nr:hypothetical protein [Corallococcus exiguus]NNB95305.1 hypothetical protein [Corallococcus exiguus]NNC03914.1 hypothetical protein [Corallococcus exiguus]
MKTGLIDVLRSWSAKQDQRLASRGVKVKFFDGGAESAYIDLQSELTISRVSLWENGLCDVESLSIATSDQVLCQHYEGLQGDRLVPLLEGLVNWMMEFRED